MVRACLFVVVSIAALASAASAQQVVLLDFWLPTCGPCRGMDPIVARLQQEGLPVRKVDGSRDRDLPARFNVDRYPTFILVVNGREARRIQGPTSYATLRGLIVGAQQQLAATARQAAPRQRQPRRDPNLAPTTFAAAEGRPDGEAAYNVGGDYGPAPEVTIPGEETPSRQARQPQPPADGPTQAELIAASVRITVGDRSGNSFGTGTMIDQQQGEALVLTCAHLFRGDDDRLIPNARIEVELYDARSGEPRVVDRVAGTLVSHDFDHDVALVAIRPRGQVQPARVAASPSASPVKAPVWSVGCDHGADPSVRFGQVASVRRYTNPYRTAATGAPVVGRSGGGLFNQAGEVVGVCFGAVEEEDQGLYANLESIHGQLDRLGLSNLYRGQAAMPGAIATGGPPASDALVPVGPAPSHPAAAPIDAAPNATVRGQQFDGPAPPNFDTLSRVEQVALEEISRRAEESEVVCVIRPKTPNGKSQVITIDRVSPEFLQALRSMQSGRSRQ